MRLRFAKPEPRKAQKEREKADRNAHIASVRRDVMQRDTRCRVCMKSSLTGPLEMHEIVPRSRLGGKKPHEIFNTQNCIALCSYCHRDVTENRIDLVPASESLGANGPVEVQPRIPK
jgi:5-methylcytosine-specific restriction endonuclease McrA